MAKGEGGEQYSNASLLNKLPSSDDIKLAKKVGSFMVLRWVVELRDDSTIKTQKRREKEGFRRLKALAGRMNEAHQPAN